MVFTVWRSTTVLNLILPALFWPKRGEMHVDKKLHVCVTLSWCASQKAHINNTYSHLCFWSKMHSLLVQDHIQHLMKQKKNHFLSLRRGRFWLACKMSSSLSSSEKQQNYVYRCARLQSCLQSPCALERVANPEKTTAAWHLAPCLHGRECKTALSISQRRGGREPVGACNANCARRSDRRSWTTTTHGTSTSGPTSEYPCLSLWCGSRRSLWKGGSEPQLRCFVGEDHWECRIFGNTSGNRNRHLFGSNHAGPQHPGPRTFMPDGSDPRSSTG